MREAALERALADLIFESEAGNAFDQDPVAFGERRGLGATDTAALLRFKDRLGIYRELARGSLEEPLLNLFPITQAFLGDAWDECVSAFLASRSIRSPHYRDIAPAFVAWLDESRWGRESWPSLLALAHFEYMEILVTRWPERSSKLPLGREPSPDRKIVISEGAQVLRYEFAVHLATVESPEPKAIPTHLMGYRDGEGEFRIFELTPATAALIVGAREVSVAAAADSLNITDREAVMSLLGRLADAGAIQGFQ